MLNGCIRCSAAHSRCCIVALGGGGGCVASSVNAWLCGELALQSVKPGKHTTPVDVRSLKLKIEKMH